MNALFSQRYIRLFDLWTPNAHPVPPLTRWPRTWFHSGALDGSQRYASIVKSPVPIVQSGLSARVNLSPFPSKLKEAAPNFFTDVESAASPTAVTNREE